MRKNIKIVKLEQLIDNFNKVLNKNDIAKAIDSAKELIENYLNLNGVIVKDIYSLVKEADFYEIIDDMDTWMKIFNNEYNSEEAYNKLVELKKRFEKIKRDIHGGINEN